MPFPWALMLSEYKQLYSEFKMFADSIFHINNCISVKKAFTAKNAKFGFNDGSIWKQNFYWSKRFLTLARQKQASILTLQKQCSFSRVSVKAIRVAGVG